MKHSRCPTFNNAENQTLASQTTSTSSYHHSPSKSGLQNPANSSGNSRPVLTGWSNSAETVYHPAGVCPPLTGLGIRYIEPTLVKTSNSVRDFQDAGEPQLLQYDPFCASEIPVPYSEAFNPGVDSSFQQRTNEVSMSSYSDPSSFQSAVEASWSSASHTDSGASFAVQEGSQRFGLGLQYPLFDWSMTSDSAASGSSGDTDASSFLAGLDIQYQSSSSSSDMDISCSDMSCSDMSISSASSTTGDNFFADFLNDEASGWPELHYPEAPAIDTPIMAAPILDINMYDAALSEQDSPMSFGVNPADTVGSESARSVPDARVESDSPLCLSHEEPAALSYPEGIKSELQTILDVLVSSASGSNSNDSLDAPLDVVEPMMEANAPMQIVSSTPRPCQTFFHYDLLPPPAQYEGTSGTRLPLLPAPPSPSPSPRSQPQTLLPAPPRTPNYSGQVIMKLEPPTVPKLDHSEYIAGSTVLDAHHGIHLEELELRAAEYRRENPGQEINKKWLLSFAGKLSERGELLDEFRCYVVGCNQRNKRRDHILIHVGAHVDQRPFQCPFCPSRFLRKNECKRHELGHTGVRPYVCHECPFKASFVRQDLLKRHMKRTHNIDTGKENRYGEDGAGPSRNRKKVRRD